MKPFSYTNKRGQAYYLHTVSRAGGRTGYVMRTCKTGAAAGLPKGFEIRENVHGGVSVRRRRPRRYSPLEEKLLLTAMERIRPFAYELDIDGKAATVYASAEDRKCFLESLDAEFADGFADALARAAELLNGASEAELRKWLIERDPEIAALFAKLDAGWTLPKSDEQAVDPRNAEAEARIVQHLIKERMEQCGR